MDLREKKFYHAGPDMNFVVFSDNPCRVRFITSISLPISHTSVEVYSIEPGTNSQWVVVQERNNGQSVLRFFIRDGETFLENRAHELPKRLKDDMLQRIIKPSANAESSRAA
jgi:hypothetical protein